MRKTMIHRISALLLVVLLALGSLAGCVGGVVGSGKLATEEFSFSDFTRIDASHAFEVRVTKSDSYSVIITADDNLFDDHLRISKSGKTLKIALRSGYSYQSVTLRAEITMPELHELTFSGATHGSVQGFMSPHDLAIEVSGASSVDMSDMSAGDIRFSLSGASRVSGDITASGDARLTLSGASRARLEGSAGDVKAKASGASDVELAEFTVTNADFELSGASNGTIDLDGTLDADLSGSSHLRYTGEPTIGHIDISGSSTLSGQD